MSTRDVDQQNNTRTTVDVSVASDAISFLLATPIPITAVPEIEERIENAVEGRSKSPSTWRVYAYGQVLSTSLC
jgi:hypothetical protein